MAESRATPLKAPGAADYRILCNKDDIQPDKQIKPAQDRFLRHEPAKGRTEEFEIKKEKSLISSFLLKYICLTRTTLIATKALTPLKILLLPGCPRHGT